MFIVPTEETIKYAKKNHDDGKPLVQINLFSYNEYAKYEDIALNNISGRDAYKKYAKVATKAVTKVGGKVLWWSKIRLTMIGPDKNKWDEVIPFDKLWDRFRSIIFFSHFLGTKTLS